MQASSEGFLLSAGVQSDLSSRQTIPIASIRDPVRMDPLIVD